MAYFSYFHRIYLANFPLDSQLLVTILHFSSLTALDSQSSPRSFLWLTSFFLIRMLSGRNVGLWLCQYFIRHHFGLTLLSIGSLPLSPPILTSIIIFSFGFTFIYSSFLLKHFTVSTMNFVIYFDVVPTDGTNLLAIEIEPTNSSEIEKWLFRREIFEIVCITLIRCKYF